MAPEILQPLPAGSETTLFPDGGDEARFSSGLTLRLRALSSTPDPGQRVRADLRALAHTLADALEVARQHEQIPLARLRTALEPVLQAVREDPDLVAWVIATELRTGFLYRRAIEAATLMARFAARLHFDEWLTAELTLGALVLDIGKITVPVPILVKPGPLSGHEQEFVRRHVNRGLDLVTSGALVSDELRELFLGHHERLDGSGYPRGIRGTQIPLVARMGAIVDSYGAMTLDRHYAQGVSPHEALRRLHHFRRRHFDAYLVREFVKAIGVWPTGGWVALADGRCGMVRAQVAEEPRAPTVLLLTDEEGHALTAPIRWRPRRSREIARALAPAEIPLDRAALDQVLAAQSG